MKEKAIIDSLLENINTDIKLLETADQKIETAKQEKRNITDRLKEYKRDLSVLVKYAPEDKLEQIKQLGLDIVGPSNGLNATASLVLSLIEKAKDNKLSNGQLYQSYVATFKKPEDAFSYADFNIKCRPLFNSGKLLRFKAKDSKSTKDDSIILSGSIKKQNQKK